MNRGNQMKAYRKYILSLPVLEEKIDFYRSELRGDEEKGFFVIISWNGENIEETVSTNIYTKQELFSLWRNAY